MASNVTKGRITVTKFAAPATIGVGDRGRVRIDLAHVDCQLETKGVVFFVSDARSLLAALVELLEVPAAGSEDAAGLAPRCGATIQDDREAARRLRAPFVSGVDPGGVAPACELAPGHVGHHRGGGVSWGAL